jgi:hypothetical protein
MSNDKTPARRPRRFVWLLFYAPGTIILWWDYYFPKNGDAWASARRKDNPTIQLLYALGFWALVVLALVAFVTSGTSTH